jgi:uncharacterized protein YecE (DUF72 family)
MIADPTGFYIGTAGWSISKDYAEAFPTTGSHLERYAQIFRGVEINSSFYRPHQPQTYRRWAQSVPDDFKFAVKIPKQITHELRLQNASEQLETFLGEVENLGDKLGPLLVQLPPSLRFDSQIVKDFFTALCARFSGEVVCEPRHASWFTDEAELVLIDFKIARAAADPAIVPHARQPGGWSGLKYYRLHGSPRIYYSEYSADYLQSLVVELLQDESAATAWCIFDNTAGFAATGNALEVLAGLPRKETAEI